MTRTFFAGPAFQKFKYTCIVVVAAVALLIYFIYSILFEKMYPYMVGTRLALIFLVVTAVLCLLAVLICNRIAGYIRYEVREDCLVVSSGKYLRRLPWANFTEVHIAERKNSDPLPLVFTVAGQSFSINPYVERRAELTEQVLIHINPSLLKDQRIFEYVGNQL